jgi:hypothetical protein
MISPVGEDPSRTFLLSIAGESALSSVIGELSNVFLLTLVIEGT